jgi:ribulose 1,5-bisphosphate synthetase/thiazole synthase
METVSTRADVVVVGGSLAGLTAATDLAYAGKSVTLFKKAASLGYLFNRGIHALYTGGAAEEVLKDLGITYRAGSPKATFLLHDGQVFPFPAGATTLLGNR